MSKHWTILHIRDGEIVNKKAVKVLFDALKDGKYLIEINDHNKRSSPQNRYYWGLVVPMVKRGLYEHGTEVTEQEVHEYFKAKFNVTAILNESTGEVDNVPLSTTRLNKEQFSDYIENIQRWAAEWLQMVIPDPGEQMKLHDQD